MTYFGRGGWLGWWCVCWLHRAVAGYDDGQLSFIIIIIIIFIIIT